MYFKKVSVFGATLFICCFYGVTSLRDVKLLVEPAHVVENGTAALTCSRDMEEAPLYAVKWYRGNHEFYRYTPNDIPNTKVFEVQGIYVDMNRSNATQVQLRKLGLALAGEFSCEVTADNFFNTKVSQLFIDIVSPPTGKPVLLTNKVQYQAGEVLRANCTSPPSRPAVNLTMLINDLPHPSQKTSLHPSEMGFSWSSISLEVVVSPEIFLSGRLRVSCVASLYDVYSQTATLDFFTRETDPRPERITFNGGSSCSFDKHLLIVVMCLPIFALLQVIENKDFFR